MTIKAEPCAKAGFRVPADDEDPYVEVGVFDDYSLYIECTITEPPSMAGRILYVTVPPHLVAPLMQGVRRKTAEIRSKSMEPDFPVGADKVQILRPGETLPAP